MMKSQEIPKKEDSNDCRFSLGFDKKEKEKNINIQQAPSSFKDSRAKSAKPLLLRKYIPTLKPVKANMNPSIIYLNAEYNYFKTKKYKENLFRSKNDINIVAEEDYERNANSGDERYGFNNVSSKKDNFLSSDEDNDINTNQIIDEEKDKDMDIKDKYNVIKSLEIDEDDKDMALSGLSKEEKKSEESTKKIEEEKSKDNDSNTNQNMTNETNHDNVDFDMNNIFKKP